MPFITVKINFTISTIFFGHPVDLISDNCNSNSIFDGKFSLSTKLLVAFYKINVYSTFLSQLDS